MSSIEYIQLDQRTHMYRNAERDLGETTVNKYGIHVYVPSKNIIEFKECPYNTAIERLFLEVLYNAIDNVERSRDRNVDPGIISVTMTSNKVSVYNEGIAISCIKQKGSELYIPSFIFGQLLTSSNYDDSKSRKVGGKFGIGVKATNIFSKYFSVEIINQEENVSFTQVWKNNMTVCDAPIIVPLNDPSVKSSTKISFILDFHRFFSNDDKYGFNTCESYNGDFAAAYIKYCIDSSLTSGVKCYFNNKEFDCTGSDGIIKYAKYYFPNLNNHLRLQSDDSDILLIDTPSHGKVISFVNGVFNKNGGIHVDTWRKACFKNMYKSIKSKYGIKIEMKMISDHFSMIVMCRLNKPIYDGQTKDKVKSPKPTICNEIESINSTLIKWNCYKSLIDEVETKTIGAKKLIGKKLQYIDVCHLQDAKDAGGPHSINCVLYVTEGNSAASFVKKSFSSNTTMGSLPLKGKMINVSKCTMDDYLNNKEIQRLITSIGLNSSVDYSLPESINTLRYGRLCLVTDADDDGIHIRGLVLNFFRVKFPDLIKHHKFLYIMETPLLKVRIGKGKTIPFFYEREYYSWINDVNVSDQEREQRSNYKVNYYKGLATSDDADLMEAFELADKLGKFICLTYDDAADSMFEMAFGEGNEDLRKQWIRSWIPKEYRSVYSSKFVQDSMSGFIASPMCKYSYSNVQRTIPCICDGLKEVQRKILATMQTLPNKDRIKVTELVGLIESSVNYKHGNGSLEKSIVSMTNDCVGTNNIPYILGQSQFDSRFGDDAGAARYIFVKKHPLMKYIFRSEDDILLNYMKEEGKVVEPEFYYPILPMFLVNGSLGIGTGFSTSIPCYNPVQLAKRIVHWLKRKDGLAVQIPELVPWYRNYKGTIEKIKDEWYSIGAYYEEPSRKSYKNVVVTEIPVTKTISSYINILEDYKTKPLVSDERYDELNATLNSKAKCPTYIETYQEGTTNFKYYINDGTKKVLRIELLPNITIITPRCLYRQKDPYAVLRLKERISCKNIVLLNDQHVPIIYDDVNAIFDEYCNIRYNAYEKRKLLEISKLNTLIEYHAKRIKFVEDVRSEVIVTRNRKMNDIYKDMDQNGYDRKLLKEVTIELQTDEGLEKLRSEYNVLVEKRNSRINLSVEDMWIDELKKLIVELEKFYGY